MAGRTIDESNLSTHGLNTQVLNDLRTDSKVLDERVNNLNKHFKERYASLEKRLDEEISDRKDISKEIKSSTRWFIGLCVTILIAILGSAISITFAILNLKS